MLNQAMMTEYKIYNQFKNNEIDRHQAISKLMTLGHRSDRAEEQVNWWQY